MPSFFKKLLATYFHFRFCFKKWREKSLFTTTTTIFWMFPFSSVNSVYMFIRMKGNKWRNGQNWWKSEKKQICLFVKKENQNKSNISAEVNCVNNTGRNAVLLLQLASISKCCASIFKYFQVFSLNKCSCTPSVCWIYLITVNVLWSIWVGKSSTLSQCTHQKENFYSIFQHRARLLTSGENCKTENYATIGMELLCAF